ncbi:hypothetical protein HNR23_004906 [Nocardiopsis mwathae]|uniref:Uncharacterized protein n=1 Tax=Nocardiopsis mwathae TaxID=1472723 RepID=A0A7X0D8L0_9ACTN|nr:hypothetical protein [Nocardiopsis mwathae]
MLFLQVIPYAFNLFVVCPDLGVYKDGGVKEGPSIRIEMLRP